MASRVGSICRQGRRRACRHVLVSRPGRPRDVRHPGPAGSGSRRSGQCRPGCRPRKTPRLYHRSPMVDATRALGRPGSGRVSTFLAAPGREKLHSMVGLSPSPFLAAYSSFVGHFPGWVGQTRRTFRRMALGRRWRGRLGSGVRGADSGERRGARGPGRGAFTLRRLRSTKSWARRTGRHRRHPLDFCQTAETGRAGGAAEQGLTRRR